MIERDATQAEQANRLKDEFLATLSHELRTPLNAILGLDAPAGAADRATPRWRARAITVIKNNAVAQSQIIEDILDVSRIIGGKLRLRLAPTSIARRSWRRRSTRSRRPPMPRTSPSSGGSRRCDPIVVDGDRIQQVCWNLLSNAVKFTPKGGHVVRQARGSGRRPRADRAGHRRRHQRRSSCRTFSIASRRPTDPRDGRHGGLGLGMAIVRHLVELHGGTVRADSAGEGQGATFTIALLAAPSHGRRRAASHRAGTAVAGGAAALAAPASESGRTHVLLVDDDARQSGVSRPVVAPGRRDRVARRVRGRRARSPQAPRRDSVLVSDLEMPEMTGSISSAPCSQRRRPRAVPAIALTAHVRADQATAALPRDTTCTSPSPVDIVQLATAIDALAGLCGRTCDEPLAEVGARQERR